MTDSMFVIGQVSDIWGDPVTVSCDHNHVRLEITGATSADFSSEDAAKLARFLNAACVWSDGQFSDILADSIATGVPVQHEDDGPGGHVEP